MASSAEYELGLGKKNQQRQDDERSRAMDEEQRRQVQELMYQFKLAHSDWTADQCREAAENAIEARWR